MSELELAINDARGCARLFRLGRDVEAGLAMVALIETVLPLVERMADDVQSHWPQLLASMFGDQQNQNWLSLADSLEFEMVELLVASQAT